MYSSINQLNVVKLIVSSPLILKKYWKRPWIKLWKKKANYCFSLSISSSDKCGLPQSIGGSPKIAFWCPVFANWYISILGSDINKAKLKYFKGFWLFIGLGFKLVHVNWWVSSHVLFVICIAKQCLYVFLNNF